MHSDSIKAFVLLAGGKVEYNMQHLAYEIRFSDRAGGVDIKQVAFLVPDDIDEEGLVVQLMLARAAMGKTGLHDPRR